ncbi:MAG: aminodeoxychorismate synthase component I [Opitutaceae bacterium]
MPIVTSESRLAIEAAGYGLPAEALFAAVHDRRGSFFLDSGLSAGGLGAFSFLGFEPFLTARAWAGRLELEWAGAGAPEIRTGEPLDELRKLLLRFRSDGGEVPFCAGAVGYFSYEWGVRREGVRPAGGGSDAPSGASPDFEFAFYDGLVAVEERTGEALLVANAVHLDSKAAILERLGRQIGEALAHPPPLGDWWPERAGCWCESLPRPAYLKAVERIREFIAAGDVYQVNLTQRFEAAQAGSPYALYRRLRERSPAPFGCCLDLGSTRILGSSPERLLNVAGGRARTRPIKGTRPRGRTAVEDARLASELASSAKDRAELLMIVDLERNDLGRVCEFGSVEVEENFVLETHPTVHHLAAQVAGRLAPGVDALACAAALFPGGSITGAPKIRAMQIASELETCPRHAYTGAVGYLGFDGSCDLNVAIRSFFLRDGRVRFHAGGGVVWDSEPEAEYVEMRAKARALVAAASGDEEQSWP